MENQREHNASSASINDDSQFMVAGEKHRKFLCEICGRTYKQLGRLYTHFKQHKDEQKSIAHILERPLHCFECGKDFTTPAGLSLHRAAHSGIQRFQCDDCGKKFYRRDVLRHHKLIHSGEKTFECMYCTAKFLRSSYRAKHFSARHAHLNDSERQILLEQKEKLKASATSTDSPIADEPEAKKSS